jgi:hypothetical protein
MSSASLGPGWAAGTLDRLAPPLGEVRTRRQLYWLRWLSSFTHLRGVYVPHALLGMP